MSRDKFFVVLDDDIDYEGNSWTQFKEFDTYSNLQDWLNEELQNMTRELIEVKMEEMTIIQGIELKPKIKSIVERFVLEI